MSLLRDLLEADIEGQAQRVPDDPTAKMQFEHALYADLSHLVAELNTMRNKLANKDLLAKVEQMYRKVDNMGEFDAPSLNFHYGAQSFKNPLLSVIGEIDSVTKDIKRIMEDTKDLSGI